MTGRQSHTAAVAGTGPAGLAAALALSRIGVDVALIGPPPAPRMENHRTAALFGGSIELLRNLGAWDACAGVSEPIRAIRLVDDCGTLLKAPEVIFEAHEAGLDWFGWNVPNDALTLALREAAEAAASIHLIETAPVGRVTITESHVTLHLKDGREVQSRLVVGADGRNSVCRRDAGLSARKWSYPQSALTCSIRHSRPHNRISTEFHRAGGPLTVVPLPGTASSIVWVERPADAQRLLELDDGSFCKALEYCVHGLLGHVHAAGPRTLFPLSGMICHAFARSRVALVGEAAHVIPPIGAQGLNLGLRDGAALADCVANAVAEGCDPGSSEVLTDYEARRSPDIESRVNAVDLLNRSLISDLLPVHLLRGAGLHILNTIGPLRRYAIQEGLGPAELPTLMRALS